jgi:hypothetical protein
MVPQLSLPLTIFSNFYSGSDIFSNGVCFHIQCDLLFERRDYLFLFSYTKIFSVRCTESRFFMRLPFREWSRIDGKFPAGWNFFFQVLALVAEVTRVV